MCRITAYTTSDYKDDGTNILLDANENAYGPGLALNGEGKLNGTSGASVSIDVDLLGLNRYPDPYADQSTAALDHMLTIYTATKQISNSCFATCETPTLIHPRTSALSTCSSVLALTKLSTRSSAPSVPRARRRS
jgi:hypothetical protein